MCRKIFAGCVCLASIVAISPAADARWIRMKSANFEVYTSASEKNGRETLRQFERVRSFFAQSMAKGLDNELPVQLVAFNSKKEYEPYRLNEFAVAYYPSGAERDSIVLSHTGVEVFPTAGQEYV